MHGYQSFKIIKNAITKDILDNDRALVVEQIKQTYLAHDAGKTVNPDSVFLRFADKPAARIIALPAAIQGQATYAENKGQAGHAEKANIPETAHCSQAAHAAKATTGIKWVASFPDNTNSGQVRASASIIINDAVTGYPVACIEGSHISATRTAASAALASLYLGEHLEKKARIGFVGCGPVAQAIADYLQAVGWRPSLCRVFDLCGRTSQLFADRLKRDYDTNVLTDSVIEKTIKNSDIIVFATTSSKPHLTDNSLFTPEKVVLHISLRDLSSAIIKQAFNLVDDKRHCLTAYTSLHLTCLETGHSDFISGTISQLIKGELTFNKDRTAIFSPFGLGVLDLCLSRFILDRIEQHPGVVSIDDYMPTLRQG